MLRPSRGLRLGLLLCTGSDRVFARLIELRRRETVLLVSAISALHGEWDAVRLTRTHLIHPSGAAGRERYLDATVIVRVTLDAIETIEPIRIDFPNDANDVGVGARFDCQVEARRECISVESIAAEIDGARRATRDERGLG
jgi:hypothetical protein